MEFFIYLLLTVFLIYFLLGTARAQDILQSKGVVSQVVGDPEENQIEEARKDLSQYTQKLLDQTAQVAHPLAEDLQAKFKKKVDSEKSEKSEGDSAHFFSDLVQSASSYTNMLPKAPELEKFEDYAPVDTGTDQKGPILMDNITTPNYLQKAPKQGDVLPVNEMSLESPAQFPSQRRNAWHDQISKENLSFYFQNNPFKFLDQQVPEASQWGKSTREKKDEKDTTCLPCNAFDKNYSQLV